MQALLTEIIGLLTGGISGIATGVGSGLQSLATSIFIQTAAEGGAMSLSVFGGLIIVFFGVSLAIGLCRWVLNWLTSFGK